MKRYRADHWSLKVVEIEGGMKLPIDHETWDAAHQELLVQCRENLKLAQEQLKQVEDMAVSDFMEAVE